PTGDLAGGGQRDAGGGGTDTPAAGMTLTGPEPEWHITGAVSLISVDGNVRRPEDGSAQNGEKYTGKRRRVLSWSGIHSWCCPSSKAWPGYCSRAASTP